MNNEIICLCLSCKSKDKDVEVLKFNNPSFNHANGLEFTKILKCKVCDRYSAIYLPILENEFYKDTYQNKEWNKFDAKMIILTNDKKYQREMNDETLVRFIVEALSILNPPIQINNSDCKVIGISQLVGDEK
jgi:hypothetical protein